MFSFIKPVLRQKLSLRICNIKTCQRACVKPKQTIVKSCEEKGIAAQPLAAEAVTGEIGVALEPRSWRMDDARAIRLLLTDKSASSSIANLFKHLWGKVWAPNEFRPHSYP
jgi:hypothetical protein